MVVCEAFVGNVILKTYEGVGLTLINKVKEGMMTSLPRQDWCTLSEARAQDDFKGV